MFLQKHRTVCLGSARLASTRTLDLRARRDVVTSWFGCRWPPRPQRRLLCQVEKHGPALTPEAPFSGLTIRTQPSTGLKRVWEDVSGLGRIWPGLERVWTAGKERKGESLILQLRFTVRSLFSVPLFPSSLTSYPLLLASHGCPGVLDPGRVLVNPAWGPQKRQLGCC